VMCKHHDNFGRGNPHMCSTVGKLQNSSMAGITITKKKKISIHTNKVMVDRISIYC